MFVCSDVYVSLNLLKLLMNWIMTFSLGILLMEGYPQSFIFLFKMMRIKYGLTSKCKGNKWNEIFLVYITNSPRTKAKITYIWFYFVAKNLKRVDFTLFFFSLSANVITRQIQCAQWQYMLLNMHCNYFFWRVPYTLTFCLCI